MTESCCQYRVTVNNAVGNIQDKLPSEQWSCVFDVIEERGGYAKLERRLITDKSILDLLVDPAGYINLNNGQVVCPCEILAEAEG